MDLIVRLIAALLFLLTAATTIFFGSVWCEARAALNKIEHEMVLSSSPTDILNQAEEVIVFSEFERTWSVEGFPCPSLYTIWKNLTDADNIHFGGHVSYFVVKEARNELPPELSVRSRIRDLFAACQLEQRFPKESLLRYWLGRAYFGNGDYGITTAANSIFVKSVDELTIAEAAQLAAVLRIPHLRNTEKEWLKRSEHIQKRFVAESVTN